MAPTDVRTWLDLPDDAQAALIGGARDARPVSGLTHNFYRYPARFSPSFVRAAIECFTEPGDMVADPYVGGGTTLVEALALGRHGLGIDISELAEFVATVKSTVLEEHELKALTAWAYSLWDVINLHKLSLHFPEYEERGYYKHLDHPSRWRLRRAIEQALASAIELRSSRLEAFARCAILRTAQWALDGRRKLPSMVEFRPMLVDTALEMIEGARELRAAVIRNTAGATVRIINRTAGPGELKPVGYSNKGGVLFNLLRDDLGNMPDATPLNYENAYSRGVVEGEYIVNVHCYRCPVLPQMVHVEVSANHGQSRKGTKPIATTSLELTANGQEKTALRFKLDAKGKVVPDTLNNILRPLRAARS